MKTLVLFLIVWAWIVSAVGSFGLTVGYFDGIASENESPFDCLETGAWILVGACLLGGPAVLLKALWTSRAGRYGFSMRWKKNA